MNSTYNTFNIGEALKTGWNILFKNFWFFAGVIAIYFAVQFLVSGLQQAFIEQEAVAIVIGVAALVIQTILNMGMIRIALGFIDKGEAVFSWLYMTYAPFWKVLGTSILFGLMVTVGLILLIIPGIILALGLQFFIYLIIDKNLGITEALKESWEITKGNRWKLFGFALLAWVINMAGVLLLGIGLLITVPLTMLAMAHIYRQLTAPIPVPPPVANPPIA